VPPLLSASGPSDRRQYERSFRILGERSKKRVSDRYFLQLLDAELNEMVTRRRHVGSRVRYMSARAEDDPFLLAYRVLPDAQGDHVTGLLAAQIDLGQLQSQLLPAIRSLQASSEAAVAILGTQGGEVIGAQGSTGLPIAAQSLSSPFDFWQVAIYPRDAPSAMRRLDLRTTLWLWLISILLLTILFGAYVFVLRVRRDAFLSRAQTTFVSNVTHELRTPLSSIKMFAELLEMQMLENPSPSKASLRRNTEQYIGIIRQECNRLSRLIDRVIDFSKVERRLEHYHFEYHDVGEVVAGIVESFRPHAEAHGFNLELSVEESLPSLRLDTGAISQALLNLLSNALQYSDDVKEIQVRVRRQGSTVAIDVSDRGMGIGAKEIGKVFDKFYTSRQRMDSRTQTGLGLGLTLSREIIRAHGGEIRVHSEVGKGSTFSIVMPMAEPLGKAAEEPPARRVGGIEGIMGWWR